MTFMKIVREASLVVTCTRKSKTEQPIRDNLQISVELSDCIWGGGGGGLSMQQTSLMMGEGNGELAGGSSSQDSTAVEFHLCICTGLF